MTLSVLIWVQSVCKGYQQTTKVPASWVFLERPRKELIYRSSLFFQSGYFMMENDLLSAHIDNCGRVVKLSVKGEEK